jgi:hypothetical protein
MLHRFINLYVWLGTVCYLKFAFCFKTMSDKAEQMKLSVRLEWSEIRLA